MSALSYNSSGGANAGSPFAGNSVTEMPNRTVGCPACVKSSSRLAYLSYCLAVPKRLMPTPVRQHINAPGAARRTHEALQPRDVRKRRLWRELDRLEGHGLRAQAIRIATGHPSSGDSLRLKLGDCGWDGHGRSKSSGSFQFPPTAAAASDEQEGRCALVAATIIRGR